MKDATDDEVRPIAIEVQKWCKETDATFIIDDRVKQLAEELNLPAKGVAIAISNSMVPRNDWEQTPIAEGADIVIIKAFCGG